MLGGNGSPAPWCEPPQPPQRFVLLSSLCAEGCSLAGIWRGARGTAPFTPGAAAGFFRNVMQQLAFLPAGTAAARSEGLPAPVLPAGFSSLTAWGRKSEMTASVLQHRVRAGEGRVWPGDGDAGQPCNWQRGSGSHGTRWRGHTEGPACPPARCLLQRVSVTA